MNQFILFLIVSATTALTSFAQTVEVNYRHNINENHLKTTDFKACYTDFDSPFSATNELNNCAGDIEENKKY
ncbi:hypothetical protein ACH3O9_16905 [Leeuwenhoekiella sp. A16]|uniref:hypothetical protein n=1 Tax=unclassified Leeuwenhoekiella TaxID=2615029 RepID=UPI003A802121